MVFFVFRFIKLKIGDDKFQGSTNFKKFEKNLLPEEGRRKEGRKAGREGGREGGDEPWPLAFFTPVERSTAHLPTLGQPKAKPSQAKTKPNQTKPGWAAVAAAPGCCCCCCCWWYSTNKPNPPYLLTYCFALTNKQTNKPKTNQPTNQPLPLPPPTQNKQTNKTHHKQNKTKQRVCSRFKPTKTKYPSLATYKSLRKKN